MTEKSSAGTVGLFCNDVKNGDYGEFRIKKFLTELYGNALEYAEDKSLDAYYQEAGIDLMLQYSNGVLSTIEVKNDQSISGNIFYETISSSRPGEPDKEGCMLTTEAENIFYMFEQLDVVLVLDTLFLREWVNAYLNGGGYLEDKIITNIGYTSKGYLIPVERLMGEHPSWTAVRQMKVFDLKDGRALTYEDFENRRQLVQAIDEDETALPFTSREEYWELFNKKLWSNNHILSYATKKAIQSFQSSSK